MTDPAAAFAQGTRRARRRSVFALAALLLAIGLGFLALTFWFADKAHFLVFLTSACLLLAAGVGVLVHGARLERSARR